MGKIAGAPSIAWHDRRSTASDARRFSFFIRAYSCLFVVQMTKPAKLSTHVLDTANGCPVHGMKIELCRLDGARTLLKTVFTNAEGRTDVPLLAADELKTGQYELVFFVGDYFAAKTPTSSGIRFLDTVPVRFGITDATASYHVPLLCSPWAYSTYRGS
jgi:5-hydroxyisourate hydrolase